ncbi:THAP domain-containing protein 4-like [Agrilus planipennis]|uniref:THAP domain-containing protein 4-like n=1 Tax=Agrilus planipennis TaxID=224129 RepID=A0A1W4WL57_AGRPL|nr:THAP domain-containing protein 4-like [Agrilus planipennis]
MQPGPMSEFVLPLRWLLGSWKSISAKGMYPTYKDFTFCDKLTFKTIGQPMLNYEAVSWNPETLLPIHLESGFLRINPKTPNVAFLVAHNFGVVTLEEGTVCKQTVRFETSGVLTMSFKPGPKVCKLVRQYCLDANYNLRYILYMETDRTPLTTHLEVVYEKDPCDCN